MDADSVVSGLNPEVVRELVTLARSVRENSYSPYSQFRVGAAVLTRSGRMFSGCNVENASYGLTICAERSALCQATAAGFRDIIAVCISLEGTPLPCGACLQCLCEFNSNTLLLLDNVLNPLDIAPEQVSLEELMPRPFLLSRPSSVDHRSSATE